MEESSRDLEQGITEVEWLMQSAQVDQARQQAGKLVQRYPDSADAWFVAHNTLMDADQQIKVLRHVLTLEPDHAAARQTLDRLSQSEATSRNPLLLRSLTASRLLILEAGFVVVLIACIAIVLLATAARQREVAVQITQLAALVTTTLSASPTDAPPLNVTLTPSVTPTYPPVSPAPIPSEVVYLPYDVSSAEYSIPLNKLVTITSDRTLRLYTLDSEAVLPVELYGPALSIALSPDQLYAAIGHEGAISYVNLETGKLEKIYQIEGTANQITIGSSGWMYYAPFSAETALMAVHMETSEVTATAYTYRISNILLHPNGDRLYYTDTGIVGSRVYRLNVDASAVEQSTNSGHSSCDRFWFLGGALQIVNACGEVYKLSDDPDSDLLYDGEMEDGYGLTSVSAGAGRILGFKEDGLDLFVWDATSLSLLASLRLPTVSYAGNSDSQTAARRVFIMPDQGRYFILAKGQANNYGEDPLPNMLIFGTLYSPDLSK